MNEASGGQASPSPGIATRAAGRMPRAIRTDAWLTQLAQRGVPYLAAVLVLGVVASHHWFWATALVAIALGASGWIAYATDTSIGCSADGAIDATGKEGRTMSSGVPGFGSRSVVVRTIAFVVLIVVTLGLLRLLAYVIGLPDGYDGSQSATASSLAGRSHTELVALQRGPVRDICLFVPAYVLYGLLVIGWICPRAPARGSGYALPRRRTMLTKITCALLVGAGVADVVETVLFHTTLSRLIDGATAAGVTTLTHVTRWMTGTKLILAVIMLVLLMVNVIRGPSTGEPHHETGRR